MKAKLFPSDIKHSNYAGLGKTKSRQQASPGYYVLYTMNSDDGLFYGVSGFRIRGVF